MDDGFYQAFLEGDHKILGKKLKPFSLWHQFLLSALESPVAGDVTKMRLEDIAILVRICSTNFPNSPIIKPSLFDAIRLFFIGRKEKRISKVAKSLNEYLSSNTSTPQFWTKKDGDSKTQTAPAVLSVVSFLISKGFDEATAWNMSAGRAKWYEACITDRLGGDVEFCYDGDTEQVAENMSEAELYEQAVQAVGEKEAKIWLESRNK